MSVLHDSEIPAEILAVVKQLRAEYCLGPDDVYVVDAEHEELSEGSYGISAECLMDWDWMSKVKIDGWWTEQATSWCLAVHPK